MSKNKFTENCYQLKDGRYRLQEQFAIKDTDITKKTEVLKEKITESYNGKELPIYGTYTIKVWDGNGFNKNRRNYRNVFNKILEQSPKTYGLTNHPKDDESADFNNIYSVQSNPQVIDGWLCVDVTFIGDKGEKCEAILQTGHPLYFSSSAVGDVDSNGYVVEDGFALERFLDILTDSPSNGLNNYLSKEMEEDIEKKSVVLSSSIIESIDPKLQELTQTEKLEEKIEEIKKLDDEIKEEKNNVTILDIAGEKLMNEKLLETSVKLGINGMIKDADKTENLSDKKQLLESALVHAQDLSDENVKKELKEKIELVEKQISEFAEKGKSVGTLNEQVTKLTEEKSKLEETTKLLETQLKEATAKNKELEDNFNTVTKMYEDKQFAASETELNANKKLSETVKVLSERSKDLKERALYNEALANTKVDAELVIKFKEQADKSEAALSDLRKKYTALLKEKTTGIKEELEEKVEEEKEFLNEEVEEYFDAIVVGYPKLEENIEDFMKCKTLKEAQILKMNLKDKKLTERVIGDKKEKIVEKGDKVEKTVSKETSALEKLLANKGLK